MKLESLYKIILFRRNKEVKNSYTSMLFKKGIDSIVQKIGEEATEVVVASKNESKKGIISEISDLWFHMLVLLVFFDIKITDIEEELEKRNKKTTSQNFA